MIEYVTLEVADAAAAQEFYTRAFGLGPRLRVRESQAPTSGFRGFTLSLVVSQPAAVRRLIGAAVAGGATTLKPVNKSLWGWGGSVQAPDGTIWKVATSARKDTGPDTGEIEQFVLLLGVDDFPASKRFYVERGLTVGRSFGRYAEFDTPASAVKLVLYSRRGLAKDAGVPAAGEGAHRLAIGGTASPFTDPDGFVWETAQVPTRAI